MPPVTAQEQWHRPQWSAEIGFENVLLHHPLGVEEGAVDGDAVAHDVEEAVAVVVVFRNYHIFQLLVEKGRILGVVG